MGEEEKKEEEEEEKMEEEEGRRRRKEVWGWRVCGKDLTSLVDQRRESR